MNTVVDYCLFYFWTSALFDLELNIINYQYISLAKISGW